MDEGWAMIRIFSDFNIETSIGTVTFRDTKRLRLDGQAEEADKARDSANIFLEFTDQLDNGLGRCTTANIAMNEIVQRELDKFSEEELSNTEKIDEIREDIAGV